LAAAATLRVTGAVGRSLNIQVVGVVDADSRQLGGLAGPSAVEEGDGGVVELDERRAVRVLQLKQWAIGRSL
jgi:hypothetical protein